MPARIIFKAHYLSGEKSSHIENYIQYMGTRSGVEIFNDDGSFATEKQKQLIEQLIGDFGKEMTESFEYEDYIAKPTKANASAAITACLDSRYGLTATKENYIDYIANRPRVEKLGEHGLFSQNEAHIDLEETASEVAHQGNNVWTDIISLRREDAEKTGFDNAEAWRDLIRSKVETIARNYKIPMRDFVWYGAFHNEGHHPHIHFVCYSKGKEGYLTEKGIENIKSSLAHEIFRQDFSEIYDRQMQLRTNLKDESTQLMEQLALNFSAEKYENTELRENIVSLAERLDVLKGKKQYGYLPKDAKSFVDAITDELAEHETIAKLYDLWYEKKEEIMKIYKTDLPSRVPLSKNNEFTSIKNMIVREVNGLSISEKNTIDDIKPVDVSFNDGFFIDDDVNSQTEPTDDMCLFDDVDLDMGFSEFSDADVSLPFDMLDDIQQEQISKDIYISWSKEYKSARLYLFGNREVERNFSKALQLFLSEAKNGNALAMHYLGRVYADGLGVDIDKEQSDMWYNKAFKAFLQLESSGELKHKIYLQYRIGKTFDTGIGTKQDYVSAADWYSKAVNANNKYAEYSLARLYYCGHGVKQDFTQAFSLYKQSADQENPYACYELAKMFRDGVGTLCNQKAADTYFSRAFKGFIALENNTPDDKLEYRLGQMLHTGTGTEKDDDAAEAFFKKSASAGNVYAQYSLAMLCLNDEIKETDKAVSMLIKAAEGDSSTAQYALGKIYLSGEIVPKDALQAEKLFIQSAEQENMYAQYTLGILYLKGEDVQKDTGTAIKYLEKSAENGNASAQYQLGKLYFKGEEIQQDVRRGIQYIEQAIENGNDTAMCFLGRAYLVGDVVPKDIHRGLELLQSASEQGNKYAEEMIKNFNFNATHTSISILHKLSLILQNNTEAMSAKRPMMPAVDKKELITIIRKKEEQGIRYD